MPKKKKTTLEFSDGTVLELAGSIRDIALNQMSATLLGLGIPQADIDIARKECIKVNSDKPFRALFLNAIARI